MHPCHPKTIPFLPGCVVRAVEPTPVFKFPLWSVTVWLNNNAYQTTMIGYPETPDFVDVMRHFQDYPDSFTAVAVPVTTAL